MGHAGAGGPERPRGLLQALLQEEGRDQLQDHQDQGDEAPGQRGQVHRQGGPQGLLVSLYCQDTGKKINSSILIPSNYKRLHGVCLSTFSYKMLVTKCDKLSNKCVGG